MSTTGLFTTTFWADAIERAVKTAAQALIATLAVGTPIFEIDWQAGLGVTATATVVSLLTSIASIGAGPKGTAGLVDTDTTYQIP